MKNIIFKTSILVFLFLSYKGISQTVIVWGGNNANLPQDYNTSGQYYYKDVHNYLDNFTGTWEFINGNEKFQITLTKIIKYHYISNNINLNYYKDGIALQYRKYINNNLIFESPFTDYPSFRTTDGYLLKGFVLDYGRISKTLYYPLSDEISNQGGEPIAPNCRIIKQPTTSGQPPKILFNLSLTGTVNYDRETYAGQPVFSIPNDVIMTKVN